MAHGDVAPEMNQYYSSQNEIANGNTQDSTLATSFYNNLEYKRFTFSEGISNKFWEVATDGPKMIIRFGRIGTNGQTQIKTFATPEEAETEKQKMIQEKLNKGYHQVH